MSAAFLPVAVSSVVSAVVTFVSGALILAPISGAASTQQPTAPVVRAERFELVDTAGKTRALLGVEADGTTGLLLYDPAGTVRVSVGLTTDARPVLGLL